jgi:hypothetical protein
LNEKEKRRLEHRLTALVAQVYKLAGLYYLKAKDRAIITQAGIVEMEQENVLKEVDYMFMRRG